MKVTAFVTTIGAVTFPECVRRLEAQTCRVPIVVLENVTPYSRALQEMVDRCETEFYLQVDEDMLLYPDAVARMLALIAEEPLDVVLGTAPLWDHEIERAIYGLKIWRHSAVRTVPFQSHVTHDRFQREQLRAAGYRFVKAEPLARQICVGDHGTHYTPEQRFIRWRRLWQKIRHGNGGQRWVRDWLPMLADRARSGTRSDLFALAGALLGAIGEPWPEDFDPYDASKDDEALRRLVELMPPRGR